MDANIVLLQHKKLTEAIRYFLIGKEMHLALKAMHFAEKFHTGLRKDNITPEFNHQVMIGHYVRTLPNLTNMEETLATVFLHDVCEDYDVGLEEIEERFGKTVKDAVWLVTKTYRGQKKKYDDYFSAMVDCPIASVVKGSDRIHNIQTMVGAFNLKKQKEYINEVDVFFHPMIKQAKRNYPEQESAYENIKSILNMQIMLIKEIHNNIVTENT